MEKNKFGEACKPGSVRGSHFSGLTVTGELERPTRDLFCHDAESERATPSSLFGLAPGGGCLPYRCR